LLKTRSRKQSVQIHLRWRTHQGRWQSRWSWDGKRRRNRRHGWANWRQIDLKNIIAFYGYNGDWQASASNIIKDWHGRLRSEHKWRNHL
jgi:hypothetical protein